MRPNIEFFAEGDVKGQPRVRATIRGRHAGVYDPGTANDWKASVQFAARPKFDGVKFEGPVSLIIRTYFKRPKSHFRGKSHELKEDAPMYKSSKPDADNVAKAIMDALTSLGIWNDDAQVSIVRVVKFWGMKNGKHGAEIHVSELTSKISELTP